MPYYVRLLAEGAEIQDTKAHDLESNDTVKDNVLTTHAGGGDIDGLEFTLRYAPRPIKTIGNLHGKVDNSQTTMAIIRWHDTPTVSCKGG